MSRFDEYDAMKRAAVEETKTGGDPSIGLVFAILALAEMQKATEPS